VEPIVEVRPGGSVRGRRTDGGYVFLGIPYAAPPFGVHRLRPPQPVEPWSGVREALAWGAKPPQLPYPPPWDGLIRELDVRGEDCLTLNVWTPELGAGGRPVMVWITGGQFQNGTAAVEGYDGSTFARDGVVLVSINYRVGAEGFALLEGGTPNLGLLDQVAALEWVRENVAAFGGDPGAVTVFGESAGGLSIGTLMAMPRAEGLFRRAVVQSGGGHYVLPAPVAQRIARRLTDALGVAPTRDALAALPVDRVLEVQGQMQAEAMADPGTERWGEDVGDGGVLWAPVIDGDVVPGRPIDRIAAGASAAVDLLAGANADESNFFLVPTGAVDVIPPEMVAGLAAAYGLPVEETLAAYRAERPGASPGELFAAVQGDWYFRIRTTQLADAHAPGPGATYAYEFAWRSPAFDGRLGACHGMEIPFVFDTLPEDTDPLTGPAPPQQLADRMHAAWVAFATTGDPGWPRYDLARRATMRFDLASEVVDDPRPALRRIWAAVR
jgi:carboxylesterase type B